MKEANNVKVYPFSKLKKVNGNEKWITSVDVDCNGKIVSVPLDYLSIQIGAEPQTGWLDEGLIALDKRGFIFTDRDLPAGTWPDNVGRAPFRYETSLPGVFTGGDVHAEVPNRMSCAIGEGAMLSVSIFRYLMTMYDKKK
jgi:thioredoxin reductase